MPDRDSSTTSINKIIENTSNTLASRMFEQFFSFLKKLRSKDDRSKVLIIQYIHSLVEDRNFKINFKNNNGNTALIYASNGNFTGIVELLLNKGADPNIQDNNGNTALMYASDSGFINIVKLLLNKGADPNIQDNNGNPAHKRAFQKNHYNIFTILSNHSNIDFYGNNQVIDELLIKDIDKVSISDKVILNNLFIDIKETLNLFKDSVSRYSVSIGIPLLKSIYTYEQRIRNKLIKLELLDIVKFINLNSDIKELEEKKIELYGMEKDLESIYPSMLVTDENTIRDTKKNLYDINSLRLQLRNKIENIKNKKINSTSIQLNNNYQTNQNNENNLIMY